LTRHPKNKFQIFLKKDDRIFGQHLEVAHGAQSHDSRFLPNFALSLTAPTLPGRPPQLNPTPSTLAQHSSTNLTFADPNYLVIMAKNECFF